MYLANVFAQRSENFLPLEWTSKYSQETFLSRWVFMKLGLLINEFQDLQTHLSFSKDFTDNLERISNTISSGSNLNTCAPPSTPCFIVDMLHINEKVSVELTVTEAHELSTLQFFDAAYVYMEDGRMETAHEQNNIIEVLGLIVESLLYTYYIGIRILLNQGQSIVTFLLT